MFSHQSKYIYLMTVPFGHIWEDGGVIFNAINISCIEVNSTVGGISESVRVDILYIVVSGVGTTYSGGGIYPINMKLGIFRSVIVCKSSILHGAIPYQYVQDNYSYTLTLYTKTTYEWEINSQTNETDTYILIEPKPH